MTWGANSWGSEDENPNRCSEALNKHACDGPINTSTGVMTPTCEACHRDDLKPPFPPHPPRRTKSHSGPPSGLDSEVADV